MLSRRHSPRRLRKQLSMKERSKLYRANLTMSWVRRRSIWLIGVRIIVQMIHSSGVQGTLKCISYNLIQRRENCLVTWARLRQSFTQGIALLMLYLPVQSKVLKGQNTLKVSVNQIIMGPKVETQDSRGSSGWRNSRWHLQYRRALTTFHRDMKITPGNQLTQQTKVQKHLTTRTRER